MHRRDTLTKAIVTVDLGKVRDNTRRVVTHLPGVDVVAVTKVTCGSPDVGAAMLAGGAAGADHFDDLVDAVRHVSSLCGRLIHPSHPLTGTLA